MIIIIWNSDDLFFFLPIEGSFSPKIMVAKEHTAIARTYIAMSTTRLRKLNVLVKICRQLILAQALILKQKLLHFFSSSFFFDGENSYHLSQWIKATPLQWTWHFPFLWHNIIQICLDFAIHYNNIYINFEPLKIYHTNREIIYEIKKFIFLN